MRSEPEDNEHMLGKARVGLSACRSRRLMAHTKIARWHSILCLCSS